MKKAKLTLRGRTATLKPISYAGDGIFEEQYIVTAYDNMAEQRARLVAGMFGWEIVEVLAL